MKILSAEVENFLGGSSMIRKMFEAGMELKKKYGDDNVYDFSLGNPDLPAPPEVGEAMHEIAAGAANPFAFGYVPNAGEKNTRTLLAKLISQEQQVETAPENVIVTCGAAGGINALFRAILERGDEVICPSPYFVEYGFYAGNFGGILKPVPTQTDFSLDIEAMAKNINAKTRAVIINSPNNPTGKIYSEEELTKLADLLRAASARNGRMIYLIADEPYRFLNYDQVKIPSVFSLYEGGIVISSFSKSLSLPGERIGYVAVSPSFPDCGRLAAALTMTNRILGFVNAPIVGQKLIEKCWNSKVDLNIYRKRRQLMAEVLTEAGLEFIMPAGAFYFFPKSPVADERIFVDALLAERVLAVPGRGFGAPGYIRLAFCVSEQSIVNSLPSFKRAMEKISQK